MTQFSMQAAIAFDPGNKAMTSLPNGDTVIVQESQHEQYRLWVVGTGPAPLVWSGPMQEKEIDHMAEQYGVDPGSAIWSTASTVSKEDSDQFIQTVETAIQALAGSIMNLRSELLVIKAMIASDQARNSVKEGR